MPKSKKSTGFIWDVADVPPDFEHTDKVASLPIRKPWRVRYLAIWVLVFLSLPAIWAWSRYIEQKTFRDLVDGEDHAAGNVEATLSYLVSDDARWRQAMADVAQNGYASPLPGQTLPPSKAPIRVELVSHAGPSAQLQVTRSFRSPDGEELAFAFDQFYSLTGQDWKHGPPPTTYWGTLQAYQGARVKILYYLPDTDLVQKQLGPYLDDTFVRLCQAINCRPGYQAQLLLALGYPTSNPNNIDTPALDILPVMSPHVTGYPIGALANSRYEDSLRAYAFSFLAHELQSVPAQADDQLIFRWGSCLGVYPPMADKQWCQANHFQ